MYRFTKLALATTALIAVSGAVLAEDAYHPPGPAVAPQSIAAAPTAPPSSDSMPGGMMLGQAAPGGMPMMGWQGQGSMMPMMGPGGPGGPAMGGMPSSAMIDHMEGRIAFLRAELKITDAQAAPFEAFAKALRENAKNLNELRGSMMQSASTAPSSLSDRLALQEKSLTARLDGLRSVRAAVEKLEAVLTEDQKQSTGELLPMQMHGMM